MNGGSHGAPIGAFDPGPGGSAGIGDDEYSLSFGALLQPFRRRLWIILLTAVVCMGGAITFSLLQTPTYEASIRLLVGQDRGSADAPRENAAELRELTRTMAEGVNSRPVAEAVIEQLGLQATPEDFLKNLRVEQTAQTQFIRVDYEDSSPERSEQIANTIGDEFSKQISEVSPSASAITATVWERAVTPVEPVSPSPARDALLGLVLGLMLGTGLAFLLEYLDNSWRTPEEAEHVTGVPTFGVVPEFEAPTAKSTKEY